MQKLNSSQQFRNFQNKFNLIEQDRRSPKFIIVFYCLCIDKECFVAIKTRI